MVVRHGEAFTITEKLTVWQDGKATYRPTVHYAYCPCDSAIVSLYELRGRDYDLQPRIRIMTDEITTGADILGALVMGHPYQSWWCGSDLDIHESRRLVPHQNATTMQVAISCRRLHGRSKSAQGVRVPTISAARYVLGISKPYLGSSYRSPPIGTLKHYSNVFHIQSAQLDRMIRGSSRTLITEVTSGRRRCRLNAAPLFVVDHKALQKIRKVPEHLPRVY
jgi:homospermidine synthase